MAIDSEKVIFVRLAKNINIARIIWVLCRRWVTGDEEVKLGCRTLSTRMANKADLRMRPTCSEFSLTLGQPPQTNRM